MCVSRSRSQFVAHPPRSRLTSRWSWWLQGDTTPYNQTIKYLSLPTVWTQLLEQCECVVAPCCAVAALLLLDVPLCRLMRSYESLTASVAAFNSANRWRKRGVAVRPVKYGCDYGATAGSQCSIVVYPADGSVRVTVSGCDIGQGVFTKVAQMVAFKLGIDMSLVRVTPTTTAVTSHSVISGTGTTSEASAAVRRACVWLPLCRGPCERVAVRRGAGCQPSVRHPPAEPCTNQGEEPVGTLLRVAPCYDPCRSP